MEDKKEEENTPKWVIILREAVREAIEEKKREKEQEEQ